MQENFRRRLCFLGAYSLLLSGCASLAPQRRIELQRQDEKLAQSRAGRFIVQTLDTSGPNNKRGSQGRFEWLQYNSPESSRQLLIIVSAFGQSLGGIEAIQIRPTVKQTLHVFDGQGMLVTPEQQLQLLSSLAGQTVQDLAAQDSVMAALMAFVSQAAESEHRIHETDLKLSNMTLRFRLAFDAQ
jgi:outer membrane biogenesis lipoprotein LolB